MRVTGLGYEADYFTLNDHDVVHVAVHHVDPLVRAHAPVWLPHIAPVPLCGLGHVGDRRVPATLDGAVCRACQAHLRVLDDWVRQAEGHLQVPEKVPAAVAVTHNRVHAMPL